MRDVVMATDYLRDPKAIYEASFRTVRAEADLDRFPDDIADVAVRLIHACGIPAIAADIAFTADAVTAGRRALSAGQPILVDANMVAAGIIRRHLSVNSIICALDDEGVADDAIRLKTTRSAAAVDRWVPHLEGAIVAVGNAPTALYRLLELVDEGAPKPAVILGFPVGFVGAAESKAALSARTDLDFITLQGRIGGSAIASAAVNALAAGLG
jgi:precorrin-8X/cobalt-precorrin-8 methylmutase